MTDKPQPPSCKPANTERVHWLQPNELLPNNETACPPLDGCLWDSHPRVFLKIDDKGEAYCPYCGTLYRLKP